jgi:hypothetical protein
MATPDELIRRLLAVGMVAENDLLPCPDSDIATLEQRLDVTLPAAYRVFLKRMGRRAGKFLRSDHWSAYFEDLVSLNGMARQLHAVGLPDHWFCFATRMGEYYLFFAANGSDEDPPVYYWSESTDPKIAKGFNSF